MMRTWRMMMTTQTLRRIIIDCVYFNVDFNVVFVSEESEAFCVA